MKRCCSFVSFKDGKIPSDTAPLTKHTLSLIHSRISQTCAIFMYFMSMIFFFQYFVGNYDGVSIVTRTFTPPIVSRCVRVHPRGWYRHITMRVELHGCTPGERELNVYHRISNISTMIVHKTTQLKIRAGFYLGFIV